MSEVPGPAPKVPVGRLGRYLVFERIASGGAATVHWGRLEAATGFRRVVAIKRLHEHVVRSEGATAMIRDEAWMSQRIRHPKVVSVVDVVAEDDELALVMEFVEGVSLATLVERLRKAGVPLPLRIVGALFLDVLEGLAAAHAATAEDGTPLDLVHRDVSPHNVLVGFDGTARLTDFGIAKAVGRLQTTEGANLKGKFAYMAPEQATREAVTQRSDLFAAGAVLWELCAGRRLFVGDDAAAILGALLYEEIPDVRGLRSEVSAELAAVLARALERDPARRHASAEGMMRALEPVLPRASTREVAAFVAEHFADEAERLRTTRATIERADGAGAPRLQRSLPPPASPPVVLEATVSVGVAAPVHASPESSPAPPPPAKVAGGGTRRRLRAAVALVAAAMGAGWIATRPAPPSAPAPPTTLAAPPLASSPASEVAPPSAPAPRSSASVATAPASASRKPVRLAPTAAVDAGASPNALAGIPGDRGK